MRPAPLLGTLLCCGAFGACASSGSSPSVDQPAPISTPVQVVTSASGAAATGGSSIGISSFNITNSDAAIPTTIEAPIDQVWPVMKSVFDSLAIPVTTLNPSTHVIGNAAFRARRRLGKTPMIQLIDCGNFQGGPSAETYDISFTITTQLVPLDARSTTLATLVQAQATPPSFSSSSVKCGSYGKLENMIVDEVRKRLR